MTRLRLARPAGRASVPALLASLLLLATAGSAAAATRHFTDANDSPGIDIHRVDVAYGARLNVRAHYDGPIIVQQQYVLWVDTVRRNPGPEFRFANIPFSEVGSLQRVSGFGDKTPTVTKCQKVDSGVNEKRALVVFRIAGKCLGNPERVRVSVQFVRPSGTSADWAPGVRRFYPAVARY